MNPIISPYLFYLADMATIFRETFLLIGALAFVVGTVLIIGYLEEEYKERLPEGLKPLIKICFVILVLSIVVLLFVPTTETVYKMIVAQNVTNDNLTKALDIIKQSIDYFVNIIK